MRWVQRRGLRRLAHNRRAIQVTRITLDDGVRVRPFAVRLVESIALVLVAVLLAALVARLARRVDGLHGATFLAVGAVGGDLLADVVSGIVHWFGDRTFAEDTPLVGWLIIGPFREHHRDSGAITHHGVLELLGNSGLGTAPLLALAW
jgi:hypothetical protein